MSLTIEDFPIHSLYSCDSCFELDTNTCNEILAVLETILKNYKVAIDPQHPPTQSGLCISARLGLESEYELVPCCTTRDQRLPAGTLAMAKVHVLRLGMIF